MTAGEKRSPPPRETGGRAARNDAKILEAAREVFLADPGAPIAAVGDRAGVGMSALYRRFPSKEHLVREICHRGLRRYVEIAEQAAAVPDAGSAFEAFLREVAYADVHTLTVRLAGRFEPTHDISGDAARAAELTSRLVGRAVDAGALRPDFVPQDVTLVLDLMSAVRVGDQGRTNQLRERYLAVLLAGLRPSAASGDLPGPPPRDEEFLARWRRSAG